MKGPRSGQSGGQTKAPHMIHTHTQPSEEKPHPSPLRPTPEKTGHAAAMAEYRLFKAAGLLVEWRRKWRHVLIARHH